MNINVTGSKSSGLASERKTKTEQTREFVNDNQVMDLLFSFIGAVSEPNNLYATQRNDLNLFANVSHVPSRATAGTTEFMPSQTQTFHVELDRVNDSKSPVLLPVTCGYFYNIVR